MESNSVGIWVNAPSEKLACGQKTYAFAHEAYDSVHFFNKYKIYFIDNEMFINRVSILAWVSKIINK